MSKSPEGVCTSCANDRGRRSDHEHYSSRGLGQRQFCRARMRSSPPPLPVVKPRIDRNCDACERHGDEHPAQRVEIWHQRQDRPLRLGQDVLRHRGTQRCHPSQLPRHLAWCGSAPAPRVQVALPRSRTSAGQRATTACLRSGTTKALLFGHTYRGRAACLAGSRSPRPAARLPGSLRRANDRGAPFGSEDAAEAGVGRKPPPARLRSRSLLVGRVSMDPVLTPWLKTDPFLVRVAGKGYRSFLSLVQFLRKVSFGCRALSPPSFRRPRLSSRPDRSSRWATSDSGSSPRTGCCRR